jgi:nucleotide-binding universal stress UspA family protein
MYRRILVPLDGSARAEAILPYVEDLAHHFGSSVILLQVLEPVYVSILDPDPQVEEVIRGLEEKQEIEASTYLNGRCGEFREKKIEASTRLARGQVVPSIVEVAAHENADLIAMASHGRTGLSHVFYGSVAAGVLHRVDRPLLLIRAEN